MGFFLGFCIGIMALSVISIVSDITNGKSTFWGWVLFGIGLFGVLIRVLYLALKWKLQQPKQNHHHHTAQPRRQQVQHQSSTPKGPGVMHRFFTWLGDTIPKLMSSFWTWTVIAGVAVIACLLWLRNGNDLFWPLFYAILFAHIMAGFILAACGELRNSCRQAFSYWKITWLWLGLLGVILAAIYGYEDGYIHWWKFPPFWMAIAVTAAPFLAPLIVKQAGKAFFGDYGGLVAVIAWGVGLIVVSTFLFAGSTHEFFNPEIEGVAFDWLKWLIAIGFFLLVIVVPIVAMATVTKKRR